MEAVLETFKERLSEIEAYLDLLQALDRQVKSGTPRIGDTAITPLQLKILYSSVYLQLYNLVEVTVNRCVEAVSTAAAESGRWLPRDLSSELQREWLRVMARSHVELGAEKRLEALVSFCDMFIKARPVLAWKVDSGGGGNWDELEIETISKRLGCELNISDEASRGVRRHFRDDKGALKLIKHFRNELAHGGMSFSDCGDNVNVETLKDLKDLTAKYLNEVLNAFRIFIDEYRFLVPERRPAAGGE